MNKIEELLEKLCPNGVEYKKLEELVNIEKGIQLNRIKLFDNGLYPVINGGIKPSGYWNEYNYNENLITISQGGASAGYINYIETKFWAGAHCYVVTNITNEILYRYLYHYLKSKEIEIQKMKVGAGIPNLSLKDINKLRVPVPSLEIQCEIIRILDKFTELIALLKAELKARKLQYEYYSNHLLDLKEYEYDSLENLCEIVDYRGKTPKKVSKGIFLVTAKNIRKGYIDYERSKEYINEEDYAETMHRGLPKIGDVLITTEAPCGNIAQVDNENIALAQRVIKYRPKSSKLNNTFLKYVLLGNEFQTKLLKNSTEGTVRGIKGSKLHKITIPIPPIDIQLKIVKILENFEKLCNDRTEGIPAEIEARQKQYEYYRDKLLTFKELEK